MICFRSLLISLSYQLKLHLISTSKFRRIFKYPFNTYIVYPIYRRLNDAQQKNRKSLVEPENSSDGDEIMPRSQSGISVLSRRSIPSQKSASRNSVDEESMLIAAELHDLPEGSESGDSETATEVDVRLFSTLGGIFRRRKE